MRDAPILLRHITEECSAHVRGLLRTALDDRASRRGPIVRRVAFNRFELWLHVEAGTAVLEDALQAAGAGVQELARAIHPQSAGPLRPSILTRVAHDCS